MTDGWTTACPDWENRIREGRTLMPSAPIFPEQAAAGLEVFRSLLVVDVLHPEGLLDEFGRPVPPTVGEVCGPWLMEIAAAVHGAYDVASGERLLREILLKVPKKNYKSGLAALLMLSLLVLNWRQSNEGAIIAPTKETADNVFKPIRDAIRADPELDALFHIQPNMRTVTHRVTGMSCRVYAADTDTVAGKIWAFVILEELWLLAQRSGAEDMVLEATGGQASRPEGIVISITTESDSDPVGVYKAKLEYARAVRDGKTVDPTFLPLLYEWPKEMLASRAYMDPANFHLVNPNWGASVDPADFMRKFEEAKAAGGQSLKVFLAKRLNVPPAENIGGSWAGAEFWVESTDASITLESLLERSEIVDVGIDGGGLDDLLGLSVVGRERGSHDWISWSKAWAHPVVLLRRKEIAQRLRGFERAGDLVMVEQIGDDVAEVAAIGAMIEQSGLLDKIGVDPAGLGGILDALVDAGVPVEKVVGISQGWKMTGAIKTTERRLAEGAMRHADQPLMTWCVGNAKVEPRGNAIVITKATAGTAKIDPLMAMFNAVSLMALNPMAKAGDMDGFFSNPVIAR